MAMATLLAPRSPEEKAAVKGIEYFALLAWQHADWSVRTRYPRFARTAREFEIEKDDYETLRDEEILDLTSAFKILAGIIPHIETLAPGGIIPIRSRRIATQMLRHGSLAGCVLGCAGSVGDVFEYLLSLEVHDSATDLDFRPMEVLEASLNGEFEYVELFLNEMLERSVDSLRKLGREGELSTFSYSAEVEQYVFDVPVIQSFYPLHASLLNAIEHRVGHA